MGKTYCADDLGRNGFSLGEIAEAFAYQNSDKTQLGVFSDADGTYIEKISQNKGPFATDTAVGVIEEAIKEGSISNELFEKQLLPEVALDFLRKHSFNGSTERALDLLTHHASLLDLYQKEDYEKVANGYLKIQQELVWLEDEYLIKEFGIAGGKFSFLRLLEGMEKQEIENMAKNMIPNISLNRSLDEALKKHKEIRPNTQIDIITANISEIIATLIKGKRINTVDSVSGTMMEYFADKLTPNILYFNNGNYKPKTVSARGKLPVMVAGDTKSDVPMMAHLLTENPKGYVTIVYPKKGDPQEVANYFLGEIKKTLNGSWQDSMKGRIFLSEFEPVPLIPKR